MWLSEIIVLFILFIVISTRPAVISRIKSLFGLKYHGSGARLPPGPPFGCSLANARKNGARVWEEYAQWATESGPLMYVTYGRTSLLLISSAKIASDLLNKRSRIYSDRPSTIMFGELIGQDQTVFRTPLNASRFKIYRKLIADEIGGSGEQRYVKVMEEQRDEFLSMLKDNPEGFLTHIKTNAAAIILRVSYGYTIKDPSTDAFLAEIQEYVQALSSEGSFGKWLVDSYPLLKYLPTWFPGASFHTFAKEQRKRNERLVREPKEWVKEQMKKGTAEPSFVERMLRRLEHEEEGVGKREKGSGTMEELLGYAAAALYVGGADTTVAVVMSFFLLMTQYPTIQSRAQAEIDGWISSHDRLPTSADRLHLPYTFALVKETMRFPPVVPLGLPHRLTDDDIYEGMFIPKGTTVIGNIWAILHDSELYPDPMTFDPTRHLPQDIIGRPPQPDPLDYTFGFGRRARPGNQFAVTSLFITLSSLLAVFDILPPLDELGQVEEMNVGHGGGTVSHPQTFECRIVPREGWQAVLEGLSLRRE
ncbi:cytochrome P450 [Sistotremastrum suecicum HHB10207 ss-3]|uniref:Cytochrome P450 n=1 Tax=Sistotremastrum suecicum HHB10207 ss-3 TaxID=1314776 RepID=A0A166D1M3_9AGAM|nr:cytochrome P450 [Sistotremastrum suecicum HHB10207 ss-3]